MTPLRFPLPRQQVSVGKKRSESLSVGCVVVVSWVSMLGLGTVGTGIGRRVTIYRRLTFTVSFTNCTIIE